MQGVCSLCKSKAEIIHSHIIPRFVFESIKNSSVGFLRNSANPNLRIQDGPKSDLLCENCEQQLSKWEKAFAERIFIPFHKSQGEKFIFRYENWALKFSVSVSWRVLTHFKNMGELSHLSEKQQAYAERALESWSEFLLEHRPNPGPYVQHILPLDIIESHTTIGLSPYINRYILRTFDMDVMCTNQSAYVYTKMGRLVLFGLIREQDLKEWKGTKLHVQSGILGNMDYHLPGVFYKYINDRSGKFAQALANMSPKQENKIELLFKEKPDEIAGSEAFKAMVQDVRLSGDKAFKRDKH